MKKFKSLQCEKYNCEFIYTSLYMCAYILYKRVRHQSLTQVRPEQNGLKGIAESIPIKMEMPIQILRRSDHDENFPLDT